MHPRLAAALAALALIFAPLGFVFFAPSGFLSWAVFPHTGRQAWQFLQVLGFVLLSMSVVAGVSLALSLKVSHSTAEQGVRALLRRRGIISERQIPA